MRESIFADSLNFWLCFPIARQSWIASIPGTSPKAAHNYNSCPASYIFVISTTDFVLKYERAGSNVVFCTILSARVFMIESWWADGRELNYSIKYFAYISCTFCHFIQKAVSKEWSIFSYKLFWRFFLSLD